MSRFAAILIACLISACCWAQETTIKGRVLDADTKEGIPFANVFFSGTTTGTSTDVDGYYELRTSTPLDSLSASALGYREVTKPLNPANDSTQTINFMLPSGDFTLSEVVVIAGENPANEIVRNIVRKRDVNRIEALDGYQYESYTKEELDLENIGPKLRNSKLLKPFEFIFENIDSTSDEKPFLPAYINETLSDVFYVKEEGKAINIPKAQRTSGVENRSVIEFISKIHQEFSIYDDWIYVLEKPFASPFSKSALSYYEYYIIDSTMINGIWSYKLKFKPKRKQDNTFYGDFWVADSVFAVQRLNMRMTPDVNINLVSRIIIFQEFEPKDQFWLPTKQKMVVDFTTKVGTPGVIGRRTETFRDFRVNQKDIQEYYQNKEPDFLLPEELEKDDAFWDNARHEPLSKNEAMIYSMVDSIKNVPIYKTYAQVLETIFTGYFETGDIQFGPYFSVYSNNPVEGHRFRLGVMNNESWLKGFRVSAYLAYGLRDKKFKYGGDFEWLISKKPRTMLGIGYLNDISLSSQNSEEFQEGDLFSGTFRRNILQKLISVEEGKIYLERYWKNGFSNRLIFLNRHMDPLGQISSDGGGFNFNYRPSQAASDIDTTISTTELIFKTRYALDEIFLDGRMSRVSLGSKHPIIEFQYGLGIKGILGSDYNYHKLSLSYRHYIYINPIGWLAYRAKVGKVYGTVPFLLAEVHPGNEGYFMDDDAFNMMNNYEFASDTYASIVLQHHFDGFFFNKLPLIRKLDLRLVSAFKAVIGTMTEENRLANELNLFPLGGKDEDTYTGFQVPDRRPYMEASVGIENIFKIMRVDAIWRLNYLDNPGASPFSVRLGIYFYF